MSALQISLPIERNQIHGGRRFYIHLSQHGGDLSTMLGAAVDQVVQYLPNDIRLIVAAKVLIIDLAIHSFRSQSSELFAHRAFQFGPLLTCCVEIGNAIRFLKNL